MKSRHKNVHIIVVLRFWSCMCVQNKIWMHFLKFCCCWQNFQTVDQIDLKIPKSTCWKWMHQHFIQRWWSSQFLIRMKLKNGWVVSLIDLNLLQSEFGQFEKKTTIFVMRIFVTSIALHSECNGNGKNCIKIVFNMKHCCVHIHSVACSAWVCFRNCDCVEGSCNICNFNCITFCIQNATRMKRIALRLYSAWNCISLYSPCIHSVACSAWVCSEIVTVLKIIAIW